MDFSGITESAQYKSDTTRKRWPAWLYFFPPAWIVMLAWFLIRIPVYVVRQKHRIELLTQFANANSFTYQSLKPLVATDASLPAGASLQLPYEVITLNRVFDRMQGKIRGMSFEYISASVKITSPLPDAQQGHGIPVGVTFFRLKVPSAMPRLYIQPKQGYHRGAQLPVTDFKKPWEYVLEGTFPKYYRVFGERDERIDILMVLSPEVMWQLVQHSFYDVWMHDDEVLLVGYGAGRTEYLTQLPTAFTFANMIASEVDRISRALRKTGQ